MGNKQVAGQAAGQCAVNNAGGNISGHRVISQPYWGALLLPQWRLKIVNALPSGRKGSNPLGG